MQCPVCRYVSSAHLEQTEQLLAGLYDLPLYHTSSWEEQDFHTISTILIQEADKIFNKY